MIASHILLLFLWILIPSRMVLSAEWDASSISMVYACEGKTVQFPWKLSLQPQQEFIENVQWLFKGDVKTELVATYTYGQFLAAEKYAGRVSKLNDTGLTLRNVTATDTGNYSVQVSVRKSNALLVSHLYSNTITLQEADGLMVKDGRLELRQDSVALWNITSEEWTIRLLCGVFTFKGPPPMQVEWILPSGTTQASSGYEGGFFYLSLTASMMHGGNYTCRIPHHFYPHLCFSGSSINETSILVDEVKAQLTAVEQGRLRLDYHRLEDSVANISITLSEALADIKSEIKRVQTSLQEEIQAVCNATKQEAPIEDACVGIHYQTINDSTGVRNVEKNTSGNLCDKEMSAGWYRWFLSGQDAVIPTSCTAKQRCGTHATMWIDLQGSPLPAAGHMVEGRACAHWESNCCYRAHNSIVVLNCGSYFIYRLEFDPNCYLAYCLQTKR